MLVVTWSARALFGILDVFELLATSRPYFFERIRTDHHVACQAARTQTARESHASYQPRFVGNCAAFDTYFR